MAKATQSTQYGYQVSAASNYADAQNINGRTFGSPLKYWEIDIPFTADNVATDVINLVRLPDGAQIIPGMCRFLVLGDPNDGAFTVDVGDAVDPDRYCDGANLAAVGIVEFLTSAIAPDAISNPIQVENTGVTTTDTSLIQLTIATEGGTMAAANVKVLLAVATL